MATLNAKSDYLEAAIINHILRATTFTSPTNTYVGLFTATPTESTSGTEATGGSYARQTMVSSTAWSSPSQVGGFAEVSNAAEIAFPVASANWGTITSFGLFDASTSGNLLYYGTLDASKVVDSGDQFKFAIGALKIAES